MNRKCLKAISSVKTKILFWNIYITLCNVVREAPDNIAQEKILRILRNVVLLLIGQHCTRQKPLQCCLRGSRQHCIRENLVQCFLNTLGTIYNKSKPYALLSERIQTALQKKKKNPVQCCFNNLGTTLHRSKSYPMIIIQCCPRGSKQHYTRIYPGNVI